MSFSNPKTHTHLKAKIYIFQEYLRMLLASTFTAYKLQSTRQCLGDQRALLDFG
jgi:hypothetical protein